MSTRMSSDQRSEKALRSIVQGALMLLAVLTTAVSAGTQAADGTNPQVVLDTGLGRIVIEVYADRAPRNAATGEFPLEHDGARCHQKGLPKLNHYYMFT